MGNLFFIVFFLILFGVTVFFIKNRLTNKTGLDRIVDLKVETNPAEGNLGSRLEITVSCRSRETVTADLIEGSLTCRQHDGPQFKIPGISGGRVLRKLIFSLGRDMIMPKDTPIMMGGFLEIPGDASATSKEKLFEIIWNLSVKVYCRGYAPAVYSKELKVHSYHPMSIEAKKLRGEDITKDAPPDSINIYRQTTGLTKDGVILIMENKHDGGEPERAGSEKKPESRHFGFLELEDEGG